MRPRAVSHDIFRVFPIFQFLSRAFKRLKSQQNTKNDRNIIQIAMLHEVAVQQLGHR